MIIETMEPMEVSPQYLHEGYINPFHQDFVRMGVRIGKNVMVLVERFDSEDQEYIIVVNTKTGERTKLWFNEEAAKKS